MAVKQWGTGMVIAAFLAGALTVGAVAASTASFNDAGVSCGAPVSAALHGKQFTTVGTCSTSFLEVLTPQNRKFFTEPLPGLPSGFTFRPPSIFTVCRQPARGRLLISVVLLAAAVLAIGFMTRDPVRRANRNPPLSPLSSPS